MHWKSAKKEFSSHLQFERGLSRNTVQAYVRDLGLLIGFAEERDLKVLGVRLQDLEAIAVRAELALRAGRTLLVRCFDLGLRHAELQRVHSHFGFDFEASSENRKRFDEAA